MSESFTRGQWLLRVRTRSWRWRVLPPAPRLWGLGVTVRPGVRPHSPWSPGLEDSDWRTRTGGLGLEDSDWRTRTEGFGLEDSLLCPLTGSGTVDNDAVYSILTDGIEAREASARQHAVTRPPPPPPSPVVDAARRDTERENMRKIAPAAGCAA